MMPPPPPPMMPSCQPSLVVVEVASLVVALVRALLVLHSIQVVPYTVLGMCMLELGVQQADEGLHTNGDRWVGNWKQEGLAFLVLQGGPGGPTGPMHPGQPGGPNGP